MTTVRKQNGKNQMNKVSMSAPSSPADKIVASLEISSAEENIFCSN